MDTSLGSLRNSFQIALITKGMRVVGAILALGLGCTSAFCQLNYGRILGAVTDQTGGAIAGTTVTVTDTARGVSRTLITDSAGEYNAPSLLPSTYTVRAEAKGFKSVDRENIALGVGQDVRIDLTLQPGEQTQTITVTESIPIVDTTDAQLGQTLGEQVLTNLPINGRQYYHLLDFTPGITAQPGASSNGNGIVSAGGRGGDVTWIFDGLDETETWAGGGPIAGLRQVSIMPIDAIQEVKIIQNPGAEYGWRSSAIVSVGVKSGTNDVHGSAYYYGRNTALDARDAFTPPTSGTAEDHLSDYGVSIGGPIKKNKIFYFGNYEGETFTVGRPTQVNAPTLLPNAGNANSITDAIAALNTAGVGLSALSLKLSGCDPANPNINSKTNTTVAPACNAANGVFGSFPANTLQVRNLTDFGSSKNAIAKFDYHLNDHNSINGEYFYSRGNDDTPSSIQSYWAEDSPQFTGLGRAIWVWTPNSSWVNEARFGYSGNNGPTYPAECIYSIGQPNYAAAFGYTPGTAGNPPSCAGKAFAPIDIGNYTELGSDNGGGTFWIKDFAWLDTVSYTRGKHLFKFGVEIHYETLVGAGKLTGLVGTTDFGNTVTNLPLGPIPAGSVTPLEDFLSGTPDSGSILIGVPNLHLTTERYAGFFQDDYRVLPRVTLNLGLRYEYTGPITDTNNAMGNFDPTSATGLVQQQSGQALYHNSPKEFAPRIGVVWDITGRGTTVARVGANLIYNNMNNFNDYFHTNWDAALANIPTGWNLTTAAGTVLPKPGNIQAGIATLLASTPGAITWQQNQPIFNTASAALACGNGVGANPSPCTLNVVNPNFPTSYVTQWTASIQHAFKGNLGVDLTYLGIHGANLSGAYDINSPAFGTKGGAAEQLRRPYTTNCLPLGAPGATAQNSAPGGLGLNPTHCFPYFNQIRYYTANLVSNYAGLFATVTERAYRGLTFNASYTLAHALDDVSQVQQFYAFNSANPHENYGNSDLDARNHFTLTATYAIPGRKAPGQLLEGWLINSSVNLLGRLPFSGADTNSDLSGTGEKYDHWTLVGPASSFNGGGFAALPCYGVAGSSFAGARNCTTEPNLAAMPQLCQQAAAGEATNPNLPAGTRNATGLQSLQNFGCYFSGSAAIVPPAQGTEGTMSRNTLRDFPFREWDASVTKDFKFRERYGAEFRFEFYNVLNHTEFALPSSNPNNPKTFGQSQSTPNGGAAVHSGGPRTMLLGLKLTF
jgi:hypothetical protein